MPVALALSLMASLPPVADAADFVVTRTDDPIPDACRADDCSLREAVISADDRGGRDTIHLPASSSSYVLRQAAATDDFGFPQVGDLDITDSVTIAGPPASPGGGAGSGLHATIHADGAAMHDRVFEIRGAGVDATIRRVRIEGGEAQRTDDTNGDGTPDFALGGGIRVDDGASLDLDRALVRFNTADSLGVGGAIFNAGNASITDSRVILNRAIDGFSGAIHTAPGASTSLSTTTVEANQAPFGGGLGAYGITTVEDSALIANHGGIGGAIRAGGANSLTTLTNTTLAHNDATGSGSAIRARDGGGLFLNAVTVARNVADVDQDGAGDAAISLQRDTLTTTAQLNNTILGANEDASPGSGDVPDCQVSRGASLILAGYDLLGDRHGCGLSVPIGAQGNQLPNSGFRIDPRLALTVADNGGPTETLALLPASPAIDAGNPAAPGPAPACPATDQRGAARERCDIGAYELTTQPPTSPPPTAPPVTTPSPPATTPPPRTLPRADDAPPVISRASLSHRRFRVGRRPTATAAVKRRRAAVGTDIRFRLSELAAVRTKVQRRLAGRRVRRHHKTHCVKPTRTLRHHRHCVRWRHAGTLTGTVAAGSASVAFSGRVGSRGLHPGRYRLRITAIDRVGNRSKATTLRFTIVARRQPPRAPQHETRRRSNDHTG